MPSNYKDLTIKAFLEDNEAKMDGRVAIRGKIVSGLKNGLFSFADLSKCVEVKSLPKFSKDIFAGKYIKILNPEKDAQAKDCLILSSNSRIIPARRIKELEDLESKKFESETCPTLASLAHLDPDEVRS